MAYEPFVFTDFGKGLNLKSKADAVGPGEAIDCKNVVFTERGAVQQRPGYAAFTSSALTEDIYGLHPYYTTGGTEQLLVGCETRLEALDSTGAVVDSETGLTSADGWGFCRFGTPNSEVAYAGNGKNLLEKWNGTAWASVSNTPKAGALCVTPTSNRLVATRFLTTSGGPTGAASTSSPDHVYFSDAGAPDTWTSTNYVQLDPGDGERTQACIAWREYVFVFKKTKFYVFTGESVGSDGSAIFNYRKVDTGVGLIAPRAVVAAENGVYFVDNAGVYITTGAEPVKISGPIDPIFFGGAEDYFTGERLSRTFETFSALGHWQDMIFFTMVDALGNFDQTFAYHTEDGWWSLWSLTDGAAMLSTFDDGTGEGLMFAGGLAGTSTRKKVYRMDGSDTNDNGTAISSFWRSGFHDLNSPGNKKVRQQRVWGSGVVSCAVNTDFKTATGTNTTLTFTNASAALDVALRRKAQRGTTFSVYFSNSTKDQDWSVHRLEHHVAGSRQPTVTQTD